MVSLIFSRIPLLTNPSLYPRQTHCSSTIVCSWCHSCSTRCTPVISRVTVTFQLPPRIPRPYEAFLIYCLPLHPLCLQYGRPGFDPWVGKIPWRRERLPTPVFWPGEFHGLHSPWTSQSRTLTFTTHSLTCFIYQYTVTYIFMKAPFLVESSRFFFVHLSVSSVQTQNLSLQVTLGEIPNTALPERCSPPSPCEHVWGQDACDF